MTPCGVRVKNMEKTENVLSPEMGATPACGAGAGAGSLPHVVKQLEEIEEIIEQKKAQIFYINRAIRRLEKVVLALARGTPPEEIEELEEIEEKLDC